MRSPIGPVLIAMSLFVLGSEAFGDSPAPPSTWQAVSPDGKFVFVMIPPLSLDQELKSWNEEYGEKVRRIRSVHAVSGMYRNDDTSEPLWTVDWYAADADIFSDGVHLVRQGPWASRVSDEAVSFFANGKLLRTWRISELVKDRSKLKRTVSHFFWSQQARLDDAALRFTLLTVDRRCYVFDATTGDIISRPRRCQP